jgi:hypothetical protein
MNKQQRITLRVMAAVVALMVLFPPYVLEIGYEHRVARDRGYGIIFDLPVSKFAESPPNPSRLDVSKLAAQIAGVLIVGGLVFLSLKDGPGKPS